MFVAGLAVVSSGMQQIYVGTMQAKHKLNANELLSNTAPAQARVIRCVLSASTLLSVQPQNKAVCISCDEACR